MIILDNEVHGASMGSTRGRQDPGGPYVAHMNLAIWEGIKILSKFQRLDYWLMAYTTDHTTGRPCRTTSNMLISGTRSFIVALCNGVQITGCNQNVSSIHAVLSKQDPADITWCDCGQWHRHSCNWCQYLISEHNLLLAAMIKYRHIMNQVKLV